MEEETQRKIEKLKKRIDEAKVILVGAGAGLSAAAGLKYSGERFKRHFADFEKKYGFHDMYSGGFYPFKTLNETWAYWSRHIMANRYESDPGEIYKNLLSIVQDKNYFVITTNVDHMFQKAGFDKKRLFYTQGDYGLFQCSRPCHLKTYDNREAVEKMAQSQTDMAIPDELIPYCPRCGAPMTMNLRKDAKFVQDKGWDEAKRRYEAFLMQNRSKNIVFLEIGIGWNTPIIIKYPFWEMTAKNPRATYASINEEDMEIPPAISRQAIMLQGDAADILERLAH